MKCDRCDTEMLHTEYEDCEVLHRNCAIYNRRIMDECPACGVRVAVIIPTVFISGRMPAGFRNGRKGSILQRR
jgi:rRNA maturation protein Nop10